MTKRTVLETIELVACLEMEANLVSNKSNKEVLRLADMIPIKESKRSSRVVLSLLMQPFAKRDISRFLLQLLEI